ncbi:MAG: tetratricopeptide repeat protein, partial [Bacteroidota bacterium]
MFSISFRTALFAALVSLISLSGCAVFEPVGGFFAQGYRNTVTYFNAYYNAQRLFRSAEEEIRAADRQRLRGVPSSAPAPQGPARTIPAPARQKLTAVIDKCSNILAFHGSSDYVDDALYLVARSYFLLGEYVKSERKCAELLAQYPASELTVPARVWLGRALLEQSRVKESEEVLMEGLAIASVREDEETQAMALESLSALHRKKGDVGSALRYASQLRSLAPDNESVAAAMLEEARLLLEEERAEQALEPLSSVAQVTDDPFVQFEAGMLKVDALRQLDRLEDALGSLQAMEQDFRFRDRLGEVQLERARLLEETGRLEEAIAAYTTADTSFVRTPTGASAAFELGSLYEARRGDYALALKQYERSAALGTFPITIQARRRASLFSRYFQLQSRLLLAD